MSVSAAVGCLSTGGLSWNSRRGPREPSAPWPSPQAGDCLRPSRGAPSKPRMRPPSLGAGAGAGDRGPRRSQLPKSRGLPSPSNGGGRRRSLRSPPASDPASKPRSRPAPKPPRPALLRWPGRSGRGPLRVQSEMSRASGRSFAVVLSVLCTDGGEAGWHTRLGDADADIPALERCAREVKSLLQSIYTAKLDVSKTLGLAVQLVLDNANVGDFAPGEEIGYVTLGGVKRQVAQVRRVWGLRGQRKGLASRESAVGCTVVSALPKAVMQTFYPPKLPPRSAPKPPPDPNVGLSPPYPERPPEPARPLVSRQQRVARQVSARGGGGILPVPASVSTPKTTTAWRRGQTHRALAHPPSRRPMIPALHSVSRLRPKRARGQGGTRRTLVTEEVSQGHLLLFLLLGRCRNHR